TGNIFAPRFRKADGTNTPLVAQTAIRPRFGTSATMNPRAGNWFSVLSTGHAAAEGQANPGFVAWQNPASGQLTNNASGVYSDWRTAVGGTAPAAPGCSVQSDINTVYNPIALEFEVRAPTNANSFSVDLYLLSSEYP